MGETQRIGIRQLGDGCMTKIFDKAVIFILSGMFIIFTAAYLYFFHFDGIGGIGFRRFIVSLFSYISGSAILIVFLLSFIKKKRLKFLYGLRFELYVLSLFLLFLSVALLKSRMI